MANIVDDQAQSEATEEHCYKDWCQGKILGYCKNCGRAGCTLHLTLNGLCGECYRKKHESEQKLADRLASIKARVKALNHDWANVISHAVPYDVRTYSDERMTHMHLDYIEKYLALPLCFKCSRIHTSKQCPRCHKPLCSYCEWGTLDMHINTCAECSLVLRREQEQPTTIYTVVDGRLALPVHFLTPNAVSSEWYSPQRFESIKEASDAFVAHLARPARYVTPGEFEVISNLRMDEWLEWQGVACYVEVEAARFVAEPEVLPLAVPLATC